MSTFYINGPSFSSASAIFTDSSLSICAPDGFYSDGIVSREQVGCFLLPQQECPSCSIPCGIDTENINNESPGHPGHFFINVDESLNTGAIIIKFYPNFDTHHANGIKATFNSIEYNKLTCAFDGLHQSSNYGNATYVGRNDGDCLLIPDVYYLNEYLYNGVDFFNTGNINPYSVSSGDISSSASDPGMCIMVIPKTTTTPTVLNAEVISVCNSSSWKTIVACPMLLTGLSCSTVSTSSAIACEKPLTELYYNASVVDVFGTVGLYDFVYYDAYGEVALPDGYYRSDSIIGGDEWFQVQDGVVIDLGTCFLPCGSPITASEGTGVYNIVLGLGTATGAVRVKFNPQSVPDGIICTLNSVQYNKVSSAIDGVLQSSVGGATYVGNSGSTSTCTSWYPSGGTVSGLTVYNWDGTNFIDSGTSTSVTIAAGQIKTTSGAPGDCIMIIPKSTTSSLPIYVSAIGACGSTVWNLTVSCPEPLPSFVSSDRYAIPTIPCEEAKNNTYYFAKVHTAADTYVGINDFVFSDINGEFPLTDGYYLISNVAAPLKVMGVTNGIVVAFTNCS